MAAGPRPGSGVVTQFPGDVSYLSAAPTGLSPRTGVRLGRLPPSADVPVSNQQRQCLGTVPADTRDSQCDGAGKDDAPKGGGGGTRGSRGAAAGACAGLLLMLTQRCPLHCAHCSSASTMLGATSELEVLLRFVSSFREDDRPEIVMMTGGEPLLLPGLAAQIAVAARRTGTRSALLAGAFFATRRRIPAAIRQAICALDHFSVSIDAYHEREVAREDVFRLLNSALTMGVPVSIHAAGRGPQDAYLTDLVAATRRVFGAQPKGASGVRAGHSLAGKGLARQSASHDGTFGSRVRVIKPSGCRSGARHRRSPQRPRRPAGADAGPTAGPAAR